MNAQLVLENVGVRFPHRVLFEGVNWTLYEGMRVALCGRNGSGKSTLMSILAQTESPHEGVCNIVGGKRLRLGYLNQSLLDSAVIQVSKNENRDQSPIEYLLTHLYEEEGGVEEWEIKKTLGGLGFSEKSMASPLANLSGGWLLRMFIVKSLLNKPEVLFLDEPTNHLDLSTIQWLEEFLMYEFKGSLLLITHDVALQKRVTDSLAILHGGHFYFKSYMNDYVSFRDSLTQDKEILLKTIEGVEKKIEENMDFVVRFRAKANTAARAQSKLKTAEKLKEDLDELKDRLRRLEGFSYPLKLQFRSQTVGSKFPISVKDLSFKYDENSPFIIKGVQFDIKRKERLAIIGDNGAGKSTLLNLLAGRLKPSGGEVMHGSGVEIGFYGQHQLDALSLNETVLENLKATAQKISLEQLRGWLGSFGFHGDEDINKKVKVLSGGERARLALLRILTTLVNTCLLDEPTNHLDIETKELLKNAILSFDGTVMFVSHDRQFIREIADRIVYISLDHQVTDHLGNLDSFFEKFPHLVKHFENAQKRKIEKKDLGTARIGPTYEERKKMRNQIRTLEKKISTLETQMEAFGQEKERTESLCNESSLYEEHKTARREELFNALKELDSKIHSHMTEWEKSCLELDTLKKNSE